MHGSIRSRLEDLLRGKRSTVEDQVVAEHLSSCPECSAELESMKEQSTLLQSLRVGEDVQPTAGFYARVMQRIEERAKDSIWSVFIYSPFGKRLAYASLTIALLLGSYVVTQESLDGHLSAEAVVAQDFHTDAPVIGNEAQQRDAVLANFAVH